MPLTILIAVTDEYEGYGDYLFALKLSDSIRQTYANTGREIPFVYIVTKHTGIQTIEKLNGHLEYGTEILTLRALNTKIKLREITVDQLIESPVFDNKFITTIDKILKRSALLKQQRIPLIMIPEYGLNTTTDHLDIRAYEDYRKNNLKNIDYKNTIYSGFDKRRGESGILISHEFCNPVNTANFWATQLDEPIKSALLKQKETLADYQTSTDLFFQYSHDIDASEHLTPAEHFLNIHREYSKKTIKNQDVIMIGKTLDHKILSLSNIKDILVSTDAVKKIIFYNSDTQEETILHDALELDGKTYRVIYTNSMSHRSMLACIALSGPFVGITGDQSLGEAVSAGKTIVYECFKHKKNLISNYDRLIINISRCDAYVQELLRLLRNASNTPEEYEQLGRLLHHQKLTAFNQQLLQHNNLAKPIADEIEFETTIANLLQQGDQKNALAFFLEHPRRHIFELCEGKNLIQYAQENNIDGDFSTYFNQNPKALLLQYITSHQNSQAQQFMLEKALNPLSKFKNKTFFEYSMDLENLSFAEHIITTVSTYNQSAKLYNALISDNASGQNYLSILQELDPDIKNQSTTRAIFLALFTQITHYKPSQSNQLVSEKLHAFIELIKLFHDLCDDHLHAFIGLLLLALPQNTPQDPRLFANAPSDSDGEFYYLMKKELRHCGINMKKMNDFQRITYSRALRARIHESPQIFANERSINLLAQVISIDFPPARHFISEEGAKAILTKKNNRPH